MYQTEAQVMRPKTVGIRFALPALAAAFVLSSVPANAATTYILDRGDMPNYRTLNISGLGNVRAGPILFDGTYGVNGPAFLDLVAFCVDIYHSISLADYSPDLTYTDANALTYDSNPGGQANHYAGPAGLGVANVTKIGVLANYGTLVAKDNLLADGAKNDQLAAVQGAIWQIASGRDVTGAGLDNLIDNLSGNDYQNYFVGNYGPINTSFKLITPTVYPAAPGTQSFAIAAVPEPATWAMMIGGFAVIGAMLRRRRLMSPDVTAA